MFTLFTTQPGTYAVNIGRQQASFTVIAVGSSTASSWGSAATIPIVGLGILVLGVVGAFVIRRLAY